MNDGEFDPPGGRVTSFSWTEPQNLTKASMDARMELRGESKLTTDLPEESKPTAGPEILKLTAGLGTHRRS